MAPAMFYLAQIAAFAGFLGNSPGQRPIEDTPRTVESKFKELAKEYDAKFQAFHTANIKAKTPEERQRVRELRPDDNEYAKRFLALAREEPKGPATLDALNRVLRCSRDSTADAALAQLRRDWTTDPKITELIAPVSISMSPIAEGLLRDIMAKNTDRNAIGPAILALAKLLDGYISLAMQRNESPEKAKRIEEYYNKEQLNHIFKTDPVALLTEADALYERAMADFADVKLSPRARQTIGEYTKTRVNRSRALAPGKPAPDIEGEDIAGKRFKLSEYRGKVVLLVFWASWCGPCRKQAPQELALLKRLQGKPFALLGVNIDHDEGSMRAAISDLGITWRNWRGGRNDQIKTRYGIQAIPLVLVLDPDGIIRAKGVGDEAVILKTVDSLVQEAAKREAD
jgi:thiol-disulfide isomerase/thioredoxin